MTSEAYSHQRSYQRRSRWVSCHCSRGRRKWCWLLLCVAILGSLSCSWDRGSVFAAAAEAPSGGGSSGAIGLSPEWKQLGSGGEEIDELFRSNEIIHMYHLQATGQLYEKGGLNHDMSFYLTAIAFRSMDRPELKVALSYYPANMTLSLLPLISPDGQLLHWENQEASMGYVLDVDQRYWTGVSYMGQTTGAFFSFMSTFSRDYLLGHPHYQPFSVYEEYPGRAFVMASSCDEFVWESIAAAQEKGVRVAPNILPAKVKIIIYTQTEPETVVVGEWEEPGLGGWGEEVDDDSEASSGGGSGGG
ncbi:unnamed protein product, partial [Discosporangium mesarthrocarpum]